MQKKTDRFLEKIVKKDYNNELEKVLEKKYFSENVKSILLSILYKIEVAYKDYETVKKNIGTKDEFIQEIINTIQNDCDDIKLVNPSSEESKILGNKTFLIDKNMKKIICYSIERKLFYCIAKISKNEKIVKENYFLLDETFSNMINVGNNINTVEPLRDFNGYSWTTIAREIESIEHNLIYQNLIMLIGNKFLSKWIKNKEFIIDYYESFSNKIEEKYGKEIQEELLDTLNRLSILLEIKYNKNSKDKMLNYKYKLEEKLNNIEDREKFVEDITKEKRELTERIRIIDETTNNKELLQKEYEKRNETLPLKDKIFSVRILSKMMIDEREEKISKIEKLNNLLNPQQFIAYKKELYEKYKYLKILEQLNLEKDIEKLIIRLQRTFLKCCKIKIDRINTKQDVVKMLFELRYYNLLPFDNEKNIYQVEELKKEIEQVEKLLIKKANELKVIEKLSKEENLNYLLLKNIFTVRIINLEDLYIKITKEKDKFLIQMLDENVEEEKIEIENVENINKKDLNIRINKNIKIFN